MTNLETLKDCLKNLVEASTPEDSIPYEIILRGQELQAELIRLLALKNGASKEDIKAVRSQIALFNELLSIQKTTRNALEAITTDAAPDKSAPHSFRGAGIKNLIANRKNGNDGSTQL